jgi:hypothetical protein
MRKEQITNLRPTIPKAELTEGISEIEKFQNTALRQIIKFQHEVILLVFSSYARKIHKDWGSLSNEKKEAFIESVMSKNQQLKNQYIGIILGLLSVEEIEFYQNNSSEINRRITQIIKQRVQTNLGSI